MADHNWKVGQTVYVVMRERYNQPREAKIVKLGRKWGTLDFGWPKYRFDVSEAWIDGGKYISPGSVYESRETYEAEVEREQAWREFCNVVSGCHYAPADIGAIETARELLFGARVKEASGAG